MNKLKDFNWYKLRGLLIMLIFYGFLTFCGYVLYCYFKVSYTDYTKTWRIEQDNNFWIAHETVFNEKYVVFIDDKGNRCKVFGNFTAKEIKEDLK